MSVTPSRLSTFASGRRTAADPALRVKVPLEQAGHLTLMVRDANEGTTFWHNHAFWGEPRLSKGND
jgi:hypothetical protein